MDGLPPLAELIAAARAAGDDPEARNAALDRWKPEIDDLANRREAAEFLGIKPATVSRDRSRIRADGKPAMPPHDRLVGIAPAWKYRTLVLHRASSPGPGGRTRWQPGQNPRGQSRP